MSRPRVPGTVRDFDEAVGLGTVAADDGRRWPFHCTQIADGSRMIAAGTSVTFEIMAGHRGSWEAAQLRPTGGGVRSWQGRLGSPR